MAVALGYAVYAGGKRINLGAFFKVTGVILILVAAGLLAHGVAEFEEAGNIPELVPLWNLSSAPVVAREAWQRALDRLPELKPGGASAGVRRLGRLHLVGWVCFLAPAAACGKGRQSG